MQRFEVWEGYTQAVKRWVPWGAAAILVALGIALGAIHLPSVQRSAWDAAVRTIRKRTGWWIHTDRVHFRAWPARLQLDGVKAGPDGGETVAAARQVVVVWRWTALLGHRMHFERVAVDGLDLNPTAATMASLPSRDVEGEAPAARSLEIGSLEIRGNGSGPLGPVTASLARTTLTGSLRDGTLRVALRGWMTIVHAHRSVDLGTLGLRGSVSPTGIVVQRLRLVEGPVELEAQGRLFSPWNSPSGTIRVGGTVHPVPLLELWNPDLAARADARGSLRFHGTGALRNGTPSLELTGRGERFSVSGLPISGGSLHIRGRRIAARVNGDGWGRVEATMNPGGGIGVRTNLTGLSVARRAQWLPSTPVAIPEGAVLDGTVEATILPTEGAPRLLEGTAETSLRWRENRLRFRGALEDRTLRIDRLEAELPGAFLRISGRAGDRMDLAVTGRIEDLDALLAETTRLGLPAVSGPPPRGRFRIEGRIRGPRTDPVLDIDLEAEAPVWKELSLPWATACLRGPMNSVEVVGSASLPGEGLLHVRGAADVTVPAVALHWELTIPRSGAFLPDPSPFPISPGALRAEGTAAFGGGTWRADGTVSFKEWHIGPLDLSGARLSWGADPSGLEIGPLDIELPSGRIRASGSIGGWTTDTPVSFRLEGDDLRPDTIPGGRWTAAHGTANLSIDLGGTVADPLLHGTVRWKPDQPGDLIGPARAGFRVVRGMATLDAPRIETAAGPLGLHLSAPLGNFPLPPWLWNAPPTGPVRIRLSGCSLETTPVLAALGRPSLPVSARGDLEADLDVEPRKRDPVRGTVTVRNLVLDTSYATMRASRPITLKIAGGRLELDRSWIAGEAGTLVMAGMYELATEAIVAEIDGKIGAPFLELLFPMARVDGGLGIHVMLGGTARHPSGEITLEQGAGRIVLTDPPVDLRNARIHLVLNDGLLEVSDGSATVNGGHVELGGGWDPESGQGMVAELERVAFVVPPGIVTRWNGLMALEPGPEDRPRLAGDLELVGGVWDTPFDLLRLASGGIPLPAAIDDPLDRISLEVEVSGHNGILVENNLGTFQLRWRRLDVGGTLARPSISGSLELLPGGRLRAGGRTVSVVRGRIELPGESGGEPEVSLVVRDPRSVSAGLETLSLADIIQVGAAASMGRMFGFESTAIDPVEIAAETETDPARRLTFGRRFGRHLSYFFTTNLADTQDTTQIVQVGDLGLPGLYGQWISSSTESNGWAVLERLQWGGSRNLDDGGERLGKVRFEGDWPVSRWLLRARLGLFAGQRWEPFLAFASRIRLERELAGYGYPDAVVESRVTGSPAKRVLTFRCTPGEPVPVRWEGDRPDRPTRRSVVALWAPSLPPAASFQAMGRAVERWFAAHGHPRAHSEVMREDGVIVIRTEKGERLELEGLEIVGLPPDGARDVERWWTGPADLAALLAGDPDALARLETTFRAEGFPETRIGPVELVREERHRGRIRVTVKTGEGLTVRSIELAGKDPLGIIGSPGFPLRPGAPLRRSALAAARRTILERYRDDGYPDVRVRIRTASAENTGTVLVELEPGVRRTIGRIAFRGLGHIREKVLRRGVILHEGEPLRENALDESLARIGAFPPVARVTANVEPGDDAGASVVIDVRERPRWTAGAGYQWSSDRGSQLLLELDDENILGRGVSARFRVRWGAKDRLGQLLFGLPPRPGGRFHLAFSSTFTHTERGRLIERTGLFSVEGWIERGVGNEVRLYLQRERSHLYEKDPDPFFPLDLTVTTASLGTQLILDRRDSLLDPRHGWFLSVDGSYSGGLLGSDLRAVRTLTTFSLATEPRRRWTAALGVRVGAAHALRGKLDPTHRFYTGGERSIRGFERDWVGPIDCFFGKCSPAGGGALIVLNNELRFPITGTLRAAVFVDAGQVWERWSDADLSLSVGAGAGLRWSSPLGPLRLDLAFPVAHKGISSGLHVYFGIGQVF